MPDQQSTLFMRLSDRSQPLHDGAARLLLNSLLVGASSRAHTPGSGGQQAMAALSSLFAGLQPASVSGQHAEVPRSSSYISVLHGV